MAYRHLINSPLVPIPAKETTCLLIINCQNGFRNHEGWGCNGTVSSPNFDANVAALLAAFRKEAAKRPKGQQPLIMSTMYRPVWSSHPLYPGNSGPWGANGETRRGVDFLECAVPRVRDPSDGVIKFLPSMDEPLVPGEEGYVEPPPPPPGEDRRLHEMLATVHGPSLWFNTRILETLKELNVRTLVIAGMSTDQHVSSAIREVYNITLVGKFGGEGNIWDIPFSDVYTDGVAVLGKRKDASGEDELTNDMMRIVLVEDATRALGRGKFDGQTLHDAHVESLKDYAEVRTTAEILGSFK